MSGFKRILVAATSVLLMMSAGCSSSKNSSSPGGGTRTYTVGVLTDLTGPAASGDKTSVQGIQAGAVLVTKEGYTIKYIVGDTGTSPAGALSAAQKLVEQDHVFAVVAISALTFAAANFLSSRGVPVVGAAEDGPEWITNKNMFSVFGPLDATKVATTTGLLFKMLGGTDVGALGYSISPTSAESAKAAGVSAAAAGLKVGYVNASFPFGSTNVAPVALAMKGAGVDSFTAFVDPNTGFALVTALRQVGADLKIALLPTGYGGDLLQAGPGALQAAQNVYFESTFEPVEMNTPATIRFQTALRSIGISADPTYAEYLGYVSIDLLVTGLKAAGSAPTQAGWIDALSHMTSYDGAGLFGSHTLDLSERTGGAQGIDNCSWITKLSGSTFHLVNGADPICGSLIPGKTVSASS